VKQVELHAPEDVRLIESPRPVPGPDEVLVAVARVGICGSDLHAYHGRHPFIQLPVVPGHEFSGTVVEVGAEVCDYAPGQRVTVEPSLVCGVCYNCTHGRYNICEELRVIGCQSPGAMAEYLAVPATKVLPLPDPVTWDQAAMAEPLAVAVHAIRVARLPPKARVLILGAGTIGLLALQVAKTMGADRVMITDLLQERLDLALQLGADKAVNPGMTDLATALEEAFGPRRADVIIECAGVAATARDAIRVARKGTRIVVAGVFEQEVPVNLGLVQDRELELVGTLMYVDDDFSIALELLQDGRVKVEPLITQRFPLDRAAEAFATADNREGSLKILIEVAPPKVTRQA
jgi:L-iditol 2-dehydrogenase